MIEECQGLLAAGSTEGHLFIIRCAANINFNDMDMLKFLILLSNNTTKTFSINFTF